MFSAPPSTDREARVIHLGLEQLPEIEVVIRRSPRARHVRLHVDDLGTVTASVPRRFALRRLDPIVRERADWLLGVLTRTEQAARATEVDLDGGGPVRLLGRWLPLRVTEGVRLRGRLDEVSGCVELTVPPGRDAYEVLERWYREEARRVISARVEQWAGQFGLRVGALSIRDQRTRWGSCSHKGDLSFNWRLVLAPLWVLDAIVVHELCHIEELNHSADFWALVQSRYPQHDDANEWLQTHGGALRISRPRQHRFERPPVAGVATVPRSRRRTRAQASGTQTQLF